ncbi:acyltransferase family protein [Halonatronum saccharophilum]|uniref:acyltransferase family protein n=1 Tax=Halonatronum saccharophilum TaxID=150060 RepID=UPI0004814FD8|nr:acyltransferase [Halonatronum saccharophilum]
MIDNYLSKKLKVVSLIAIVMVVYIYAYNLTDRFLQPFTQISDGMNLSSFFQYFVSNGVTRVAVPLFFVISVYLFYYNLEPKRENFLAKYKSRAKTLLVPYLLCSLLSLLFLYLAQEFILSMGIQDLFPESDFTTWLVRDYGFGDYIVRIFLYPAAYQLWFILDLMIYVILSPLIYYYLKKSGYLGLIPFAIFWLLELNLYIINPEGILFFMLGALLVIKGIDIQKKLSKKKVNATLVLWLIILGVKTLLAYYGFPIILLLLHKIAIILGLFGLWYGYDIYVGELEDDSKLLYLTSFTFFIFLFHVPLLDFLTDIWLALLGSSPYITFLVYLVNPLLVMGVIVLLGDVLRNFLKPVYSTVTGGRGIKV